MTTIQFSIPAIPVGQPRQRHRIIEANGRTFAQNYTPAKHKVNDFKATARMAATQAYSGPPLDCPLRMTVAFVFPRTAAQTWKRRPMPRLPHAKKPDRDNCEKALLDALKGLLFVDDAQVCCGEVSKWIAAGDEQPHVEILIEVVGLSGAVTGEPQP